MAVSYHSKVYTAIKLCSPYHNWVHTISWFDIVHRQTRYILVQTSMYANKAKWQMCMTWGFELSTWCIPSCLIYHYATMVKSLVISMDTILYIDPGQDICDTLYPLAGVGRPALVPHSTPLRPWRHWSGYQTWISQEFSWKLILAAQHGLEAGMKRRTAARVGLTEK